MAFGTYKAPFPRGRVLRGWDPQNPTKQTKALPVKEETKENGVKDLEWIYPGHLIAGVNDGTKTVWTKAMPASGDFILAVAAAALCSSPPPLSASLTPHFISAHS